MTILAQATVEVIRAPTPIITGRYRVEVTGREPHDYVRYYDVLAHSEGAAAFEGIQMFSEDIVSLLENQKELTDG